MARITATITTATGPVEVRGYHSGVAGLLITPGPFDGEWTLTHKATGRRIVTYPDRLYTLREARSAARILVSLRPAIDWTRVDPLDGTPYDAADMADAIRRACGVVDARRYGL